MIKIIQRTTDNKYLKSAAIASWVDNIEEAFEMTYRECNTIREILLKTYTEEQLKEIVDMRKNKPITQEEKQELINMLKKR